MMIVFASYINIFLKVQITQLTEQPAHIAADIDVSNIHINHVSLQSAEELKTTVIDMPFVIYLTADRAQYIFSVENILV